jgi:hypothetical protein
MSNIIIDPEYCLYSSEQLEALNKTLREPNPDAPAYEPEIWNTAPWDMIGKVHENFKNVINAIYRDLIDPAGTSIDDIAVHVLSCNAAEVGKKFGVSTNKVQAYKDALVPVYNNIGMSTTCYDYAANNRRILPGAKGMPGATQSNGWDEDKSGLFPQNLVRKIELDKFVQYDPLTPLPPKHYLTFLFVKAHNQAFHLLRQDKEDFSHKDGHADATNLDALHAPIKNPLDATLRCEHFVTAFAVPSGGITTAPAAQFKYPASDFQ